MTKTGAPGPIVEVEWIDPGGMTGWHPAAESTFPFETHTVHSVGFLVEDSARGVAIVAGYGQNNNHLDSTVIPRSNVQKVTRLRRGR